MPYIHVSVSGSVPREKLEAARDRIAELMPTLPTKTRDNTMIQVDSAPVLSMGDPSVPCLFMEARLFQASPSEAKQAFVAKVSAALEEELGVRQSRMYMNIFELRSWASGGKLTET